MVLKNYIEERKKSKEILIMTHQIMGYPSFDINSKAMEIFCKYGIDMVELQIPHSDPVADGPLFSKANQEAIDQGVKVSTCLDYIEGMTHKYDIPILIMTYYNIIYQYGIEKFVKKCREINVKGIIVPDAPPDEARELYDSCQKNGLDAAGFATAFSKDDRLKLVAETCGSFVYFNPRKGVTGFKTHFNDEILQSIARVKAIINKPIGVGFGLQSKEDVDYLKGTADIAILGSKILNVIQNNGIDGLESFIKSIAE